MPKPPVELQPEEAILLFGVIKDYLYHLELQKEYEEEILVKQLKLALTTRKLISDQKLIQKAVAIIDWAMPEMIDIQNGWRLIDIRQKIKGATSLQVVTVVSEKEPVEDYERL
jgi:hypothetical protein